MLPKCTKIIKNISVESNDYVTTENNLENFEDINIAKVIAKWLKVVPTNYALQQSKISSTSFRLKLSTMLLMNIILKWLN